MLTLTVLTISFNHSNLYLFPIGPREEIEYSAGKSIAPPGVVFIVDADNRLERVMGYAQQALDLMEKRGIAAHPNNFTVWYHYFAETYPDLKKELDKVLASKEEIVSAELYERFFTFSHDESQLSSAADKIETQLERLVNFIGDSQRGAKTYGDALEGASKSLHADLPIDDLAKLIEGVKSATSQMQTRTRMLEDKLTSSAMEMRELRKELDDTKAEAMTDGLTGLANRKTFDSTLRRLAGEASQSSGNLCLAMLDIDRFKKFNDTYGHQVGDQVIKLVASVMSGAIPRDGIAARYGGEEFALILPNVSADEAVKISAEICSKIRRRPLVNRVTNESLGKVTISAGVAKLATGEPIANFIGRADEALLKAKREGRDRVFSEYDLS